MIFVIETQVNGSNGAVIPFSFTDREQAEAKYHSLLAVAAVSNVERHSVVMINEYGFLIKSETYSHEVV